MKNKIDDGGPAFPFVCEVPDGMGGRVTVENEGITMLDWFAGSVQLTKFDELLIELYQKDGHTVQETIEYTAQLRFRIAVAMIAERKKSI